MTQITEIKEVSTGTIDEVLNGAREVVTLVVEGKPRFRGPLTLVSAKSSCESVVIEVEQGNGNEVKLERETKFEDIRLILNACHYQALSIQLPDGDLLNVEFDAGVDKCLEDAVLNSWRNSVS